MNHVFWAHHRYFPISWLVWVRGRTARPDLFTRMTAKDSEHMTPGCGDTQPVLEDRSPAGRLQVPRMPQDSAHSNFQDKETGIS